LDVAQRLAVGRVFAEWRAGHGRTLFFNEVVFKSGYFIHPIAQVFRAGVVGTDGLVAVQRRADVQCDFGGYRHQRGDDLGSAAGGALKACMAKT
jgi:hypothetical protein